MRPAHPTERAVGMTAYVSDTDGTGGRLRAADDHFRVRELERFSTEPIDASTDAYPHLVFRATLHGWDTNDFAARISDALGVSRERINWAGTKDKYAVTTQLFSVYSTDAVNLPDINDAELEPLGRAGRSLEFGDLAGNAFEVVISDPAEPANATDIARELRAFGSFDGKFGRTDGDSDGGPTTDGSGATEPSDSAPIGVPNYFGQQRFGSRRPVTHEVGLEIARGDWEGAVMAYLGAPTEAEPDGTQAARSFIEETRDWQQALDRFPNRLRYERSMLHELAACDGDPGPDDFRAALESVPSNLQRLFVHAAQSYAFNLLLGERLERGLPFDRPVAGDVVCFTDTGDDVPAELTLPDTDRLQRVDERRIQSVTRHCERNRAFVTAPLVGTDTELADGEPGEIERDVLDDLGLRPGDFDLPGEFHSTGTRRAILVRTALGIEQAGEAERDDSDALTLSFSLPKGSYATVVLREFMKVDPIHLG
ncbi:tRNA pseudouridine(13) synthase TruD [Natrialba sp. PRR66]|uniref:tRNA pseudouridine(13) synthase TruD n=1 Tax=Natrialba sp. PRR66 TaxID=3098146 RepID=UPI002B1E493B|nr:tRNA pseudouridine(13) synthase TruD [Natrialba sp. PRR66]